MIILAAGTTGTVIATVVAFLVISLILVSVLLFVKQKLSPSGPVKILINGEREIEVSSGGTLLSTLGNHFTVSVEGVEVFNVNVMQFRWKKALPTETLHFGEKNCKRS